MFSKFGNERQKRWSLFVQQNKKIFYLLTKTVTRQGNFEFLKKIQLLDLMLACGYNIFI